MLRTESESGANDHSEEYSRGEVIKVTEIESEDGEWVYLAVDKMAE